MFHELNIQILEIIIWQNKLFKLQKFKETEQKIKGLNCSNSTFSSFIFEYFVFVHVWLWKAKLWLMFLSTHSFQNLSPSWAQLLNLMGSLMSIFKKILPIPSSAIPSGRSAAPNVANSQNICHSYSFYCWGLCAFSIDHILIISITWNSIYILQPLLLSPVSSDPHIILICGFLSPFLFI